jgi:hypothetical protein
MMLCFTALAYSATLIVDNNIPSSSQYTTLQAAHDAASSGDKIYVMPSNGYYSSVTVTKNLEFAGTGWNPDGFDSFFIKSTNVSGTMYFGTGSEGASISGFGGHFNLILGSSNLTIKKCFVNQVQVDIGSSPSDILLIDNLIKNEHQGLYPAPILIVGYSENYSLLLYNNVIVSSFHFIVSRDTNSLSPNCTIVNNTFITDNGIIGNFYRSWSWTSLPVDEVIIINNIIPCELNNSPNSNYNITGQAAIECTTINYHIQPGSVAINAGNPNIAFNDLDGSINDCGAYGGPTPFVDGGIPGFPSIYEINGVGVASPNETIEIQIKAKTNRD